MVYFNNPFTIFIYTTTPIITHTIRPRAFGDTNREQCNKKSATKPQFDSILSASNYTTAAPCAQAQKKKHPFNNNLKNIFKLSHILT
jgi:hypothetical protein